MSAAIRIAVLLLLALPVHGQQLQLDPFSFVSFPGLNFTAALTHDPLPLSLTEKRPGVWNLRLDSASIPARAVQGPDGKTLGIAIDGDPGGECVGAPPALHCRLLVVLAVVPRGVAKAYRVPISFTTGSAGKSSNLAEAAREGAPLDLTSGLLQLVGVGEAPPDWGRLAGEPFLVVLSGVVTGVPAAAAQ